MMEMAPIEFWTKTPAEVMSLQRYGSSKPQSEYLFRKEQFSWQAARQDRFRFLG